MELVNEHPPIPQAGDWVSVTALGPNATGVLDLVVPGGIYEVERVVDTSHGRAELLIKVADGKQVIIAARHGDSWEIASAAAEVRPLHPEKDVVRYAPEPSGLGAIISLTDPDIDVLRAIGLLRYGEQIDTNEKLMHDLVTEVFERGLIEVRGAMRRTAVTVLPPERTAMNDMLSEF